MQRERRAVNDVECGQPEELVAAEWDQRHQRTACTARRRLMSGRSCNENEHEPEQKFAPRRHQLEEERVRSVPSVQIREPPHDGRAEETHNKGRMKTAQTTSRIERTRQVCLGW